MDTAAAVPACRYLFPKIQDVLSSYDVLEASVFWAQADASNADLTSEEIYSALGIVVKLLDKALTNPGLNYPPWLPVLLEVLANATREQPFWRPLFGHPRSQRGNSHSSCVLDSVHKVIKDDTEANMEAFSQQVELLNPALRIMANCCADDNISRALMIDGGGVENLKTLVSHGRAINLVIPTIYNVCVDFDGVALDEDGKPLRIDQLDTVVELTAAEQALGRCSNLSATTTLQQLLRCHSKTSEATIGFLADLAEMSSRPVLFGDHRIFKSGLNHSPQERREVIRDVLTMGRRIIAEDEDTKSSIIQTLLNLLSQTSFQEALAQSDDDLFNLINMFELLPENDPDLKRYADSLSQMLYAVSSLPQFAETFVPGSEAYQDLRQKLEQQASSTARVSPHELAAPIVLLANSLTTPERISQSLSESSQLTRTMASIIHDASSSVILVPAFDVANRLALIPEGQSGFASTEIFDTLVDKLQIPTTSPSLSQNHTLTIHRSAITLARQLIKPYSKNTQSSTPMPPDILPHPATSSPLDLLHSTILALFTTTPDDATKLEIGRYAVTFLRRLTSDTGASDSTTHPSDKALSRLNSLLQPVIHLLVASPSATARAEGVFGLGLFLSLITRNAANTEVEAALSLKPLVAEREKVLAALGQVLDAAAEARGGAAALPEGVGRLALEEAALAEDSLAAGSREGGGGARAKEVGGEVTVAAESLRAAEQGTGGIERRAPEEQNVMMVVAQLSRALEAESKDTDSDYLVGRSQLMEGLQVLARRMGLQT